jgi:hypothetical protein
MEQRDNRDGDRTTNPPGLKIHEEGAPTPAPAGPLDVISFRLTGKEKGVLQLSLLTPIEWWQLGDDDRRKKYYYSERFNLYVTQKLVWDDDA